MVKHHFVKLVALSVSNCKCNLPRNSAINLVQSECGIQSVLVNQFTAYTKLSDQEQHKRTTFACI